ncbi:MAG: hypothetical protein RL230_662 [Pseudomonadota bacterium]|jgi:hypothetical protein
MRNQMDEGDLAGIPGARKHTFAKKGRAKVNPIEPTDQIAFVPGFNAKGVTTAVQPVIEL